MVDVVERAVTVAVLAGEQVRGHPADDNVARRPPGASAREQIVRHELRLIPCGITWYGLSTPSSW